MKVETMPSLHMDSEDEDFVCNICSNEESKLLKKIEKITHQLSDFKFSKEFIEKQNDSLFINNQNFKPRIKDQDMKLQY